MMPHFYHNLHLGVAQKKRSVIVMIKEWTVKIQGPWVEERGIPPLSFSHVKISHEKIAAEGALTDSQTQWRI